MSKFDNEAVNGSGFYNQYTIQYNTTRQPPSKHHPSVGLLNDSVKTKMGLKERLEITSSIFGQLKRFSLVNIEPMWPMTNLRMVI